MSIDRKHVASRTCLDTSPFQGMIGQTPRKRKVNDHKLTVKVKHLNFFLRFALFHKTLLSGLSFFSFFLSAISFIQSNSFLSTSTIISFYSYSALFIPFLFVFLPFIFISLRHSPHFFLFYLIMLLSHF